MALTCTRAFGYICVCFFCFSSFQPRLPTTCLLKQAQNNLLVVMLTMQAKLGIRKETGNDCRIDHRDGSNVVKHL